MKEEYLGLDAGDWRGEVHGIALVLWTLDSLDSFWTLGLMEESWSLESLKRTWEGQG